MARYSSIVVIVLLFAAPAFGQSLAEDAKKAQEQRQESSESTDKPGRVWTNADLPNNGRSLFVTGMSQRLRVPFRQVPRNSPSATVNRRDRPRLNPDPTQLAEPLSDATTVLCPPIGNYWSDYVPCLNRKYRDLVAHDPWCPGSVNCGDPAFDYAVQSPSASPSLAALERFSQPNSGTSYDPTSGNRYRWEGDADGTTKLRGYNAATDSRWLNKVYSDGSQFGINKDGETWRYNAKTEIYINDATGQACKDGTCYSSYDLADLIRSGR